MCETLRDRCKVQCSSVGYIRSLVTFHQSYVDAFTVSIREKDSKRLKLMSPISFQSRETRTSSKRGSKSATLSEMCHQELVDNKL